MRRAWWLLWFLAAGVAFGAGLSLYRAWIGPAREVEDFTVFLHAAQHVAAGHNPYGVRMFIYPPLLPLLLAPFSHLQPTALFRGWAVFSLLAFACAAVAVAFQARRDLQPWHPPVLVALAALTTYHWWPMDYELSLGQSDLLVLAVVAFAGLALSRGSHRWGGLFLGLGAFLKAWPVALAVHLWRRRQRSALTWVISVCALIPLAALGVGGWAGLKGMGDALTRPHHGPSYSAWSAPSFLFAATPHSHALVVSRPLELATGALFVSWVLVVLVVTIRRHEPTQPLAFWHVVGCSVLLLPLTQFVYVLYLLPILWLWGGRVLARRRPIDAAVFALLLLWWHFGGESWNVGVYAATPAWRAAMPFFLNLGALTISSAGLLLVEAPVAHLGMGASGGPDPRMRDPQVNAEESVIAGADD